MSCSLLMLISKRVVFKAMTFLGIVLYNLLILHYHVIVPNYYALGDWVGIMAGILAITAADMEQNSNMQTSKDKSDKKDMWDNLIYNIEWCYFYYNLPNYANLSNIYSIMKEKTA